MIRDGKDGSGILPITVLGDTIKEIIDNETCFKLTNVTLKNYNKLSTMLNTKVTSVNSDTPISWSNVDATQFFYLRNRISKILNFVEHVLLYYVFLLTGSYLYE